DLLVVDRSFGGYAESVRKALIDDAARGGVELRTVEFDSENSSSPLLEHDFEAALTGASKALLFCHVSSALWYAPNSGIWSAPTERYRPEQLAKLDLSAL